MRLFSTLSLSLSLPHSFPLIYKLKRQVLSSLRPRGIWLQFDEGETDVDVGNPTNARLTIGNVVKEVIMLQGKSRTPPPPKKKIQDKTREEPPGPEEPLPLSLPPSVFLEEEMGVCLASV